MNIPIAQFEQYIDEVILKRGLSYFKKDYVNEPEEITPGMYEAIVAGSEDYTVELKIKNGVIREHVCTCPYDMGPVCKHVAAVLFYLQENILNLNPKASLADKAKGKSNAGKLKKKTVSEQVNEILEKLTHDELKQFISDKTRQNPEFRNIFLASFAYQNSGESKEFYAKQVKSILRAVAGREGFIYWNQAGAVGKQISDLLTRAEKQIETKNYKSAVFVCTAVMEEMTEALQFADDSGGDIGGNIELAYQLLFDIAKEKLPEEIRIFLLNYCLWAFEKCIFSGWDWHLGMMRIAAEILADDDEAQRIITHLDKIQDSGYEKEEAQGIKFNIIKKSKGEKEADIFIQQNLSNPNLRREAIIRAIRNKEYEKAVKYSHDGVLQDEKEKPGLAKEWYDWLLKIAQAQDNSEKIIEYARYLFIDNFRNEQDYYKLLKDNVRSQKWTAFVEDLIKDITAKKRWMDIGLISEIYVKEQWWSRLLELIKEKPSLSYIEQYEKYLSKNYAEELVLLYGSEIINYMKNNTGRSHYQTACKYLRRMMKLGGNKSVEKIVSDFRKQYPQRRALMEELERI